MQNDAETMPKPSQNCFKWCPNHPKAVSKSSQSDPKAVTKSSQNGLKVISKQSQNDLNVIQTISTNDPKLIQNQPQSDPNMIPTPGLGGSDEEKTLVWLFLKTLLSLIVFWPDTCLVKVTLSSQVFKV